MAANQAPVQALAFAHSMSCIFNLVRVISKAEEAAELGVTT